MAGDVIHEPLSGLFAQDHRRGRGNEAEDQNGGKKGRRGEQERPEEGDDGEEAWTQPEEVEHGHATGGRRDYVKSVLQELFLQFLGVCHRSVSP